MDSYLYLTCVFLWISDLWLPLSTGQLLLLEFISLAEDVCMLSRFSSVRSLSRVPLCDPMNCSTPGLPVYHQLPEFTQTHIHWVSDAIQPSHPLSSPSPPGPNPSRSEYFPMSQLFAWSGQSIGVSALASFLPKKSQGWSPLEWTGLDLLVVQGTLKSLLQHYSSKASILRHSAFFTVQISHPYMTTGKTIALTIRKLWLYRLCRQSNVSAF